MSAAAIELQGVGKTFGRKSGLLDRMAGRSPAGLRAVHGVDLKIRSGEVFGLVGESGCGKSTLARIFAGLIAPSHGSIAFAGKKPRLQMVFQDPFSSLNARWRVADIVAEPIRTHGLRPAAEVAGAGGGASGPGGPAGLRRCAVSAGLLRRPAAAHLNRAGARGRAGFPDPRRADERPRRLPTGADPQPVVRPAGPAGRDQPLHHPQPLGRAADGRPHRRHVPGRDRGAGADRGIVRGPETSLYPAPDRRSTRPRPRRPGAAPEPGGAAEPVQPAGGLHLPHPLSSCAGCLRPVPTGASAGRRGLGALPLRPRGAEPHGAGTIRDAAVAAARAALASGACADRLAGWVARRTASRLPDARAGLTGFVEDDLAPLFRSLGFRTRLLDHPTAPGPCLNAERIEEPALPTVLQYGHGDVVAGLDGWSEGLDPFAMTERGGLWYGRGTADNKGQLCVNLTALEATVATRGSLGFNLKYLVEMVEESGSPGLREVCRDNAGLLAADMLLASDGPRLARDRPTLFLGARGGVSFYIEIVARDGFQHSGNWGGLLSNPGVELCHAIAALIGCNGEIRPRELVPEAIPGNVRHHLSHLTITPLPDDPPIDPRWGEPGLTAEEKVFAWSSLEVMEMGCGNLAQPLYAIPPRARARLQLRFPVGVDVAQVVPSVRRALSEAGFGHVVVHEPHDAIFLATRLDPDHPWVGFVAASIARTTGAPSAILPGIGGSLPNDIFATDLGLPTLWVPHSYPGCRQPAASEHMPIALAEEALGLMAGLYWDFGEKAAADLAGRNDRGQP